MHSNSSVAELFQEIKAAMPSAIKGFKEEYSKILDVALTALSGFIEKRRLFFLLGSAYHHLICRGSHPRN